MGRHTPWSGRRSGLCTTTIWSSCVTIKHGRRRGGQDHAELQGAERRVRLEGMVTQGDRRAGCGILGSTFPAAEEVRQEQVRQFHCETGKDKGMATLAVPANEATRRELPSFVGKMVLLQCSRTDTCMDHHWVERRCDSHAR
jgi:hypothetical protein